MQDRRALGLRLLPLLGMLLFSGWSHGAAAFSASVVATVNLRAGPSIEYPVVAILGAGAFVEVFGCEEGYGWCDVQVGMNRGWVAAEYLQAEGPSGPLIVADGGVLLALPIIAFSFGTYWDTYYRGRPWYGRRGYYYNYWNRYPHGRPPPPYPRPPGWRPPPYPAPGSGRPPADGRPPGGGSRPPGGGGGRPPGGGNGRPPGGGGGGAGRPPGGGAGGKPPLRPKGPPSRPAPQQPQPQPRP